MAMLDLEKDDDGITCRHNNTSTLLSLLETSYRQGAHEAFLLSMLFLVTIFPGDPASLGGAIFCAGWRTVLAVTYLSTELFATKDNHATILPTILELVLVLPIFILVLLLLREYQQTQSSRTSGAVKYTPIHNNDEKDDLDDDAMEQTDQGIFRIRSLSMYQMVTTASLNYSPRQRLGALIHWMSTGGLFIGMTIECLLLITTDYNSHEVYSWGMHVCAMYVFNTHMAVQSPTVYSYARWLLFCSSPAGTLVAAWQLWILLEASQGPLDAWAFSAAILFVWRGLCGMGQTIGLIILDSTEPLTQRAAQDMPAKPVLVDRLSTARFILFKIYVPILFLNIVFQAASSTLLMTPLVSTPGPGCMQQNFLLAKHWPGMGTFFHFGGLLVIFASDSLSSDSSHGPTSSYPPSLVIATMFTLHVAVLLAGDLLWSLFDNNLQRPDSEYTLQVLWALSAVGLGIALARVWKWRIITGA